MKNIIIKKRKSFAAFCAIAYLTMSSLCYGQIDTIKGTPDEKIVKFNSDSANKQDLIKTIGSTKYNMFGDLLNDDPIYNKKTSLWMQGFSVLQSHILLGLIDRYVFNYDFARIGFNSWKHNINTGWEWDTDRFGMNFFGHPYGGGLNFSSARSNGYSFWEALPFAIVGSLMWEYLGENTLPAYNDQILTPISGAFFGEVLYRLSSNVLDDRTTGSERFFRELGSAVLAPKRFVNRLLQGKLTRLTTEEVYQKNPLNIELSAGFRKLNDGRSFWTGPQSAIFNLFFDYGYPFEKLDRKPFDYFKIRAEANFGVGRKILDLVSGYGILYCKNIQTGSNEMLIGLFQHYNYFDNMTFELGAIAVGGGLMSKLTVFKDSYLFTNFHLGIVPIAGNSTQLGPDTTQVRDYNFGGGLETKLECGLNLGWGSIPFIGYYYWIQRMLDLQEIILLVYSNPEFLSIFSATLALDLNNLCTSQIDIHVILAIFIQLEPNREFILPLM
jgi:hypothetical protein